MLKLNNLPEDIQELIWKYVFQDSLDIINTYQNDPHRECNALIRYLYWSAYADPLGRCEREPQPGIMYGHGLLVSILKPLFYTEFKDKKLLYEFTEYRYKYYFPTYLL